MAAGTSGIKRKEKKSENFFEKSLQFLKACGIVICVASDKRNDALVGVNDDEGPPVPIPNTVVKLIGAEDTWLATAWENRTMPTS